MSKDKSDKGEAPAKAKGKGMMMIAIVAVAMLALGGGGAFALVHFGVLGGGGKAEHKEELGPKLVKKGEEDPYAPKGGEGGHGEEGGAKEVEGEGGSPYKTTYYNFTEDSTSNLKESQSLIQVSLACFTHRDGRVVMWLKKHELAVRSAMLTVLADTPDTDIATVEGKEKLQKRLTAAINQVLTKEEGFGGVDDVYFKSFLVQ